MFIWGWFLFGCGFLLFFVSNLQDCNFLTLLPSYILIVFGGGLLGIADWRQNKNPRKKLSLFAVLCFILGYSGFLPGEDSGVIIWLILAGSIAAIIFGIIFKVQDKKEPGLLVGNSLFIAGVILAVVVLLAVLLLLLVV